MAPQTRARPHPRAHPRPKRDGARFSRRRGRRRRGGARASLPHLLLLGLTLKKRTLAAFPLPPLAAESSRVVSSTIDAQVGCCCPAAQLPAAPAVGCMLQLCYGSLGLTIRGGDHQNEVIEIDWRRSKRARAAMRTVHTPLSHRGPFLREGPWAYPNGHRAGQHRPPVRDGLLGIRGGWHPRAENWVNRPYM
jgi:hypothetical protein